MKTPKVSIIIPFYNLGKYLDEAVNSVLNQTYKNWEILIINDGSTDQNSVDVLEKYSNNEQIKVFNKKNEGLPVARNYGIERAEGEYICCLDADDKYHPDFLKKTLEEIQKDSNLGFVTTWFQPFGEIQGEDKTVQITKNTNLLLVKNVPHVASMFRKQACTDAGGYEVHMKHGYQDWDFWLSIVEAGYDWHVIPEVLFYYRVRSDSMLRETSKRDLENYSFILNKHKRLLNKLDITEILISARQTILAYDHIIQSLNKNKPKRRILYSIKESIKHLLKI